MLARIIITFTFILTAPVLFSQDFAQQFKRQCESNDTSGQLKTLEAWKVASPESADMYIAYFNYYVSRSITEIVSIDKSQTGKNSFTLTDTGTGKPVAYLNSSSGYNSEILEKGFNYIDKGIALHPKRLDMRFGKVHMLGQAQKYQEFAQQIIAIIKYDSVINNGWLWKDDKPVTEGKGFLLDAVQDYIGIIYNAESDSLLPLMRQISEAVIIRYPDHVESLSNIALTHLIGGEYDKGLPYLLRAEGIAPKDVIVLNNIAQAYKGKGDKVNAKAYYDKVIKYGDSEQKKDARQKLKSL